MYLLTTCITYISVSTVDHQRISNELLYSFAFATSPNTITESPSTRFESSVPPLTLFTCAIAATSPPSSTHRPNTSTCVSLSGSPVVYAHIACSSKYTLDATYPVSINPGRGKSVGTGRWYELESSVRLAFSIFSGDLRRDWRSEGQELSTAWAHCTQ